MNEIFQSAFEKDPSLAKVFALLIITYFTITVAAKIIEAKSRLRDRKTILEEEKLLYEIAKLQHEVNALKYNQDATKDYQICNDSIRELRQELEARMPSMPTNHITNIASSLTKKLTPPKMDNQKIIWSIKVFLLTISISFISSLNNIDNNYPPSSNITFYTSAITLWLSILLIIYIIYLIIKISIKLIIRKLST